MRGLLKAKPVPGKGIFVIMMAIVVITLLIFDITMITDYI